MSYGITTKVEKPFDETVTAVKESLAGQGFGVLTEIDMAATLKEKLDVAIAPQVILGVGGPQLRLRRQLHLCLGRLERIAVWGVQRLRALERRQHR